MNHWSEEELDGLATRLTKSEAIAQLSAGPAGTIAAYLPGRRIPGLRVLPDGQLEIHVVMASDTSVGDVEGAVRRAVDGDHEPRLFIDDVEVPGGRNGPSHNSTNHREES